MLLLIAVNSAGGNYSLFCKQTSLSSIYIIVLIVSQQYVQIWITVGSPLWFKFVLKKRSTKLSFTKAWQINLIWYSKKSLVHWNLRPIYRKPRVRPEIPDIGTPVVRSKYCRSLSPTYVCILSRLYPLGFCIPLLCLR